MARQETYEAQALKLIQEGREKEAAALLQKFINENCARVEKEYAMLNNTLERMLETIGVNYVFEDYLKDWTSAKGVPLPVH